MRRAFRATRCDDNPTMAVKRLGAHHNTFHGVFMAADAVVLNNTFGLFTRADGNRDIPR